MSTRMDPIKILQILVIAGVVITGTFYLLAPYKSCKQKTTTLDGYLLADQKIIGYQFANTLPLPMWL